MSIEAAIKALESECDSYDQTVQALKAVANEFCWDDKSRSSKLVESCFIGRRLDTSPDNRLSPSTTVTPDLVLRTGARRGILGEAKVALSDKPELREQRLRDLQKYDDKLIGWDTPDETVDGHDIVLVVHQSRAVPVCDQIRDLIEKKSIRFDMPFAVVSFTLSPQAQVWMALRLEHGSVTDLSKMEKLRKVVSISMEILARHPRLALTKIYDHPPPLPLMLNLMHETIMGQLTDEELQTLRYEHEVATSVRVDEIQQFIGKTFGPLQAGPRTPSVPQRSWIVEAFEKFCEIGWAQRSKSQDSYVYVAKRRKKAFKFLVELCARPPEKAKAVEEKGWPKGQLGLFG